ncbi:MAG: hypothetical protein ACFFA0_04345 [Promethearchaeota archaeon]
MRNKILYVYTENLNFFYRVNKELNRFNIKFKIISGVSKIPDIPSLLLTTSSDIRNFRPNYKRLKFLVYDEESNFHYYILKIIAAYRIAYKDHYSNLMFSIDPGSKKIGLVVFLDDYYLASHTFYDKSGIIEFIKDYINCFQINNPNLLKLRFKFGSGVLQLTSRLIQEITELFPNRYGLEVYLIDESKSSKIKIQDIKKTFKTKHELSALILALRNGVEVNQSDDLKTFKQIKFQKSNKYKKQNDHGDSNDTIVNLQDIIEKIINNEISLSESSKILG